MKQNGEHSDIISPELQLNEILPIEIKATHFLGHQDDHVAFEILSRSEQMNVRIDAMTKYIISQVRKGHMKPEGNKIVHHMAFPVVTYENIRAFDDIKILYTHLYWIKRQWING